MGFGNRGGNSAGSDVDWKAMNEYRVAECAINGVETLVGVISGIYDLGMQQQQPGQVLAEDLTPEQEEAEIAKSKEKGGVAWFEDLPDYKDRDSAGKGKIKRFKLWESKDCVSIGFVVDFPEIMLDMGQFFGDDSGTKKPLRMVLGGEFQGKMSSPATMNIRKNTATNDKWSLVPNNSAYRLAIAAGLKAAGEPVVQSDIPDLLGKAMQFEVKVGMKGQYLQESCKLASKLGRGQEAPAIDADSLHLICMCDSGNTEAGVKQIHRSAMGTLRESSEFKGSILEKDIERWGKKPKPKAETKEDTLGDDEGEQDNSRRSMRGKDKAEPKAAPARSRAKPDPEPDMEDYEDDIPF